MNRIAEAECDTCHSIRPKTEMRPVKVRRKSGSSFSFWRTSQSDRPGQSYRTSYSHDQVWVCRGCKAPRSDWTPIQYAAAATAAAVALLVFVPGGTRTQTTQKVDVQPSSDNIAADTIVANDLAATDIGAEQNLVATPDKRSEQEASTDGSSSEPRSLVEPDPLDITRSTNEALVTGAAAHWSSNGLTGWVTVSEPASTEKGVCKTVVIQTDDHEQIGDMQTWCAAPGMRWAKT